LKNERIAWDISDSPDIRYIPHIIIIMRYYDISKKNSIIEMHIDHLLITIDEPWHNWHKIARCVSFNWKCAINGQVIYLSLIDFFLEMTLSLIEKWRCTIYLRPINLYNTTAAPPTPLSEPCWNINFKRLWGVECPAF